MNSNSLRFCTTFNGTPYNYDTVQFEDIIEFSYRGGDWIISVSRLSKIDWMSGKELCYVTTTASFGIGGNEYDCIEYNGKTYAVTDFPTLVKKIHTRSLEKTLEVLE